MRHVQKFQKLIFMHYLQFCLTTITRALHSLDEYGESFAQKLMYEQTTICLILEYFELMCNLSMCVI